MSYYPKCGCCGTGRLIPVDMGNGSERTIKYRCTNPECSVRFDIYGYETYDTETQRWQRLTEG